MWIYKSDTLGDVSRFKALFVAKGFNQHAGLDYTETFPPVIRMARLRLFLAIAGALTLNCVANLTSTHRFSTRP
jgi:hypothetical protein